MIKRKVAIMTVIALLCATAAPAAIYANGLTTSGLTTNSSLSILSTISNFFKPKNNDKKNDSSKSNPSNAGTTSGSPSSTGNATSGNSSSGNATSGSSTNSGGSTVIPSSTNGTTDPIVSDSDDSSMDISATSAAKKPDPKAVSLIVLEAASQLNMLQARCQISLVSTALLYSKAKTTHEKTVLYAQGKATYEGCVASFTTIIATATKKLLALGSDASPLDPLKASFTSFQAEGKAMLNRIVK